MPDRILNTGRQNLAKIFRKIFMYTGVIAAGSAYSIEAAGEEI